MTLFVPIYGGRTDSAYYVMEDHRTARCIYALQCINRTKLVLVHRPSASIAHNGRALYCITSDIHS